MDNNKTLREIYDTLGITRRVIQGYGETGLVSASGKNKYGHLLYDENAQKRIVQIRLYQQLGFQRKEIKGLLDAPAEVIKAALEERILHLKQKQDEIQELLEKAYELLDNI